MISHLCKSALMLRSRCQWPRGNIGAVADVVAVMTKAVTEDTVRAIVRANLERLVAANGDDVAAIARDAFGEEWAEAGRSQLRRALDSGSLGAELAAALMGLWGIDLAEFYLAPDGQAPEDIARQRRASEFLARADLRAVDEAIGRMDDERLATIVRQRIDGKNRVQVGASLGISRERVRQLEPEAFEALRRVIGESILIDIGT